MTSKCPKPHARHLEALMTGDGAGIPADERAALEGCPVCTAELAGLRRAASMLDAAGVRQEELLALAEREAGEEEERLVRLAHEQRVGTEPRRAPRLVVWAAAAAVLVASLFVWATWGDGESPGDRGERENVLDGEGLEIVSPEGPESSFVALIWQDEGSAQRTYSIEVWGLPEGGEPYILLEESRVRGTRLDLDPTDTDTWPTTIEWTLRARDASGQWIPGAEATAVATRERP